MFIHVNMHIYTHRNMFIHVNMYIYTHRNMFIHVNMYICIRICIYAQICIYSYEWTPPHTPQSSQLGECVWCRFQCSVMAATRRTISEAAPSLPFGPLFLLRDRSMPHWSLHLCPIYLDTAALPCPTLHLLRAGVLSFSRCVHPTLQW